MNGIEAIALLVTALVVPYVVALIKNKTLTGNKARWIAIGVSVLAGVVTAFVSGIPARSEERRVGKECRSRWSPYH